ncbi:hypothetical protein ACL02R_25350 [Streptomyces sp. MS19]|uniref:hypothetical protein n=1 Tax=Streptomyces sp. MS19 TaxID=3385972 RepID=UPI0039A35755
MARPPGAAAAGAARGGRPSVVHIAHGYASDLSDLGPAGTTYRLVHADAGRATTAPGGTPGRVLVRGTWNTEVIREPGPGDPVVGGTRTLVVTGRRTGVRVEPAVREAAFPAALRAGGED